MKTRNQINVTTKKSWSFTTVKLQAKRLSLLAAIAIISIALIGCGGEDDPPPETFTVSFNANGGSPTPPDQTVEKGKTVSEPAGVTKANNTLDGWYKESALTTKWNFADGNGVAADTVTASITLFAKWIETPIDNITGNAGKQIPIYKTDGVSDEDAATDVANIKKAFNASKLDPYRDLLSFGIKKIYLLAGGKEDPSANGSSIDLYSFDKQTGILKVASGWTYGTYLSCFEYEVYPALQETVTFDKEYKVSIISDDQFTAAEWTTLCANVVTALETAYTAGGAASKIRFRNVFGQDGGVTIILVKNPTDYTNYKVGTDFKTLYLNVDNIASVNYGDAIAAMNGKNSSALLMKD